MRTCKAKKTWDKVYKRTTNDYFDSLDLFNFYGINQNIDFPKNGIIAFCGLNGVGKSTILTSIKSLIGMELNELEKIKISSTYLSGSFISNNNKIQINNSDTNLKDIGKDLNSFIFIDFEMTNKMLDFLIKQENVHDLIESNEFYEYTDDKVKELNTIIGKNYKKIEITEIELEDNYIIPFFRVIETDFTYDTLTMGKGEYYLFYMFWQFDKANENTTFIIDEPENGISIASQKQLMNYVASKLESSKIKVIITTHSPFVLHRLKNDNIKILSRIGRETQIIKPKEPDMVEKLLSIEKHWEGILIVEDKVAEDFLFVILEHFCPYILNDYKIVVCSEGKNGIEKLIKSIFNMKAFPLKVIGVFDGDVTSDNNLNSLEGTCCLPGVKPLEEEIREYLDKQDKRILFCKKLDFDCSKFSLSHSKYIGEDYHDWFIDLFNELHVDGRTLIKAYFELTLEDREDDFNKFIETLKGLIEA